VLFRNIINEINNNLIKFNYRLKYKYMQLYISYITHSYICIKKNDWFQEEREQLARSERMAINASNIANMVIFVAKVYASVESKSLAVIASTLDSLLDLLSGFILWFTSSAMRKPNQHLYPIGKDRMQPVVRNTS
jgi:Co/Zn/Cd efflux system component